MGIMDDDDVEFHGLRTCESSPAGHINYSASSSQSPLLEDSMEIPTTSRDASPGAVETPQDNAHGVTKEPTPGALEELDPDVANLPLNSIRKGNAVMIPQTSKLKLIPWGAFDTLNSEQFGQFGAQWISVADAVELAFAYVVISVPEGHRLPEKYWYKPRDKDLFPSDPSGRAWSTVAADSTMTLAERLFDAGFDPRDFKFRSLLPPKEADPVRKSTWGDNFTVLNEKEAQLRERAIRVLGQDVPQYASWTRKSYSYGFEFAHTMDTMNLVKAADSMVQQRVIQVYGDRAARAEANNLIANHWAATFWNF